MIIHTSAARGIFISIGHVVGKLCQVEEVSKIYILASYRVTGCRNFLILTRNIIHIMGDLKRLVK